MRPEVTIDRTSTPPAFILGPQGTTNNTPNNPNGVFQLAGIIDSPENIFLDQGRFNKVFTFAETFLAAEQTLAG